jgi:hypothetical protein
LRTFGFGRSLQQGIDADFLADAAASVASFIRHFDLGSPSPHFGESRGFSSRTYGFGRAGTRKLIDLRVDWASSSGLARVSVPVRFGERAGDATPPPLRRHGVRQVRAASAVRACSLWRNRFGGLRCMLETLPKRARRDRHFGGCPAVTVRHVRYRHFGVWRLCAAVTWRFGASALDSSFTQSRELLPTASAEGGRDRNRRPWSLIRAAVVQCGSRPTLAASWVFIAISHASGFGSTRVTASAVARTALRRRPNRVHGASAQRIRRAIMVRVRFPLG